MKVFDEHDSLELMKLYIDTFVDKSLKTYSIYNERLAFYLDHAVSPKGVLWDLLYRPIKITKHTAVELVKESNKIYAFIDPCDTNGIIELFELDNGDVDSFVRNNEDNDMYFFNDSLQKTIVLTHEYVDKERRYCIVATAM